MLALYDVALGDVKRDDVARKIAIRSCAESDSNIIKYVFKDYKLSEITRNIYSYIIKGLSH